LTFIDYLRLRASQLRHLAIGGDAAAEQELSRRQRDAPPALDVAKMTYGEARGLVLSWRQGATTEEQAQSRIKAEAAQLELEARFRVRARIGWRAEDAAILGPRDIETLPAPPWLAPQPPTAQPWRRPTGSTHYRSDADRQRDALRALASQIYAGAAGVPRK
jgi:hypothetical protein